MTRARCIHLLTFVALVAFVVYVFSPSVKDRSFIYPFLGGIPGLGDPEPAAAFDPEKTTDFRAKIIGADELLHAFYFSYLRGLVSQLSSAAPSRSWLQSHEFRFYGVGIAQEGLLMLGSVILSQLPLLASARIALRPRLCQILAMLLLFCAVSVVCTRVDFLNGQARRPKEMEQLAFGAWLPPMAFALASVALFLRRNAGAHTVAHSAPAHAMAASFLARLRSLPLTRRLGIAALTVFVAYLYCPVRVSVIAPKFVRTFSGMNELTRFFGIGSVFWWDELGLVLFDGWHIVFSLLLLAGVVMSQLPLLTSPRIPLRPRVCWTLAIVLVLIAASVVWMRLEFMVRAARAAISYPEQSQERFAFGAWLAPLAFVLAAAAVLVRRKEAGTESESGK
jgi:hypothetical protein